MTTGNMLKSKRMRDYDIYTLSGESSTEGMGEQTARGSVRLEWLPTGNMLKSKRMKGPTLPGESLTENMGEQSASGTLSSGTFP